MDNATWPRPGDRVFYRGDWDVDATITPDDMASLEAVVLKAKDGALFCVYLEGGLREVVHDGNSLAVQRMQFNPEDWFPTPGQALRAAADEEQGWSDRQRALAARLREVADALDAANAVESEAP